MQIWDYNAIQNYNANMGGVDFLDRMIAAYRQNSKSRKWTVRLIFHMIDFVCASAWIEYRSDSVALKTKAKNTLEYFKFKISISQWLLYSESDAVHEEDNSDEEEASCSAPKRKKPATPYPSQAKRRSGEKLLHAGNCYR